MGVTGVQTFPLPFLTPPPQPADAAVAEVRAFPRAGSLPQAEGTPDAVGRDRYALAARRWTGSDLGDGNGLEEAYAWGWAEHRRILAEQRVEAGGGPPGAVPRGAERLVGPHRPPAPRLGATRAR